MSLAVAFANREQIPRFLRWVVQPQVAYPWADGDRFVVVTRTTTTRAGRGTSRRRDHRVWLWLPDADPSDPGLQLATDMVECTRTERLPREAEDGRHLTLEQFLRAATLARLRTTARKTPHDLLAAYYDVPPRQLAESFATVPKNPAHPSSVAVLEPATNPDIPDGLLLLPQADPTYPWSVWLDAENRRLAPDGPAAVKLYYQLPGGTTGDYYLEYGYAHPFPELRELYPNREGARAVLISATDRSGNPRTHWAHLIPRVGDRLFEIPPTPDVPFDFDPGAGTEAVVADAIPTGARLHIRPRLEEVSAGQRTDLESIERSIQGAKNTLARLEQTRLHLLARRQGRFRLVLRFRQDPPGQETPELAANLQRFLLLSRRQLGQFQYVFADDPAGGGSHLVYTRDSVFYRDLHVGLADAVYYQPAGWQDWQFDVFVRDDCELVPRIDSGELAGRLYAALGGSAGWQAESGAGRLLLLDPVGTPGGDIRITAVSVPLETDLPGRLGFMNTDHPVATVRSRSVARREMADELAAGEVDLEQEVRRTEETVAEEALRRLTDTQRQWNETAAAIDRTKAGVDQVAGQQLAIDQMLARFAHRWQQLVTAVLGFNDVLVAPKIEAFAVLETARAGWADSLARVEEGHREVDKVLPPIRQEIEQKVEDGRVTHARVEAAYRTTEAQAVVAEAELERRTRQVEAWQQKVQTTVDRIEARHAELRRRVGAIQDTLTDLEAMIARLAAARAEFVRLTDAVETEEKRGRDATADVEAAAVRIRDTIAGWKKAVADARARQVEVEQLCDPAAEQIERLRKQVHQTNAKTAEAETRVHNAALKLADEQRKLRDRIDRLRAEAGHLTAAAAELDALRPTAAAAEKDREAAAAQLAGVVDRVNQVRSTDLQALTDRCRGLVADLDTLAELELTAAPLRRLRRMARLRAQVAAGVPGFDPLSADDHASIWDGVGAAHPTSTGGTP